MKRREFLKTTRVAGAATLGAPFVARAQAGDTVNVGHLVGICMSPLFYAHAPGYFKDEGLNVQLKFMPNPGDAHHRARSATPWTSSTTRSPTPSWRPGRARRSASSPAAAPAACS